ncbi:cell division protein FtsQ/DivIB [Pontiella sulfatireligans]|uniref:Cell division protein DivIB n=1 Tax=Pontiella sulfatireligans TaxID=2750658 RepID=A0A6C2UWB9_9BACT|nr:FtsQ-type POTRA domain-containing protein [Pontiella sulfatireligans]VGO23407.1 Cell division protein DivIB [Pontiella sulfatireligans]
MAARKKTTTRKKPQYVRANKRKGADSSALARRSFTVFLLILIVVGVVFGVKEGFEWINHKLFSKNPRFEIQHLEISCDGKLTEDRIREYTGLREGTNLFAVSFGDIEKELSKVPVIESVYLERKLPNTLIVGVKERVAIARIEGLKSRRFPFVVDRYGYVLPPRQSAAALPLIKGLDSELRLGLPAEHKDVETALKVIALCDSTGYLRAYVRLESLDVKYSDFIDMRLQGGIRVRMPRFSLKPKLQNLATVIKIATGQGQRVKEVDLTLDSAKVPVTYY